MRVILRPLAILPLVLALAVLVTPAQAATTVSVSGTFVENRIGQFQSGCSGFVCGAGTWVPFGRATDVVTLNPCGDPFCGVNTKVFTFEDGSTLVLGETLSSIFNCTANTDRSHSCGQLTGSTTDVVLGGTGRFENVTGGTLTSTFGIAGGPNGGSADTQYTGTITFG